MEIKAPKYLQELIDQKEGINLDFKFEISDSKKIARTLVAFANTEGGKILLGVKDNGKIAGVRTDEELYMLQAAARMYSKPKIDYFFRVWNANKKMVVEVTVPKSKQLPHYALDDKGRWRAYIRVKDKNFVVPNVQLRVWKILKSPNRPPVSIKFKRKEDLLLKYLENHDFITFKKFYKLAKLPPKIAEDVLVDLIIIGVIDIQYTDEGIAQYVLSDKYEAGKVKF